MAKRKTKKPKKSKKLETVPAEGQATTAELDESIPLAISQAMVQSEILKQERAKAGGKQAFDGIARIYAEKGFVFVVFTPTGRKKYGRDQDVLMIKKACLQVQALNQMIPLLPMGKNADTAQEIKEDLLAAIKEARDQVLDPDIPTIYSVAGWTKDFDQIARHRWAAQIAEKEAAMKARADERLGSG